MKLGLRVALASIAFLGAAACAPTTNDPDRVNVVTTDIPHFWQAYDDAAPVTNPKARADIFRREYFDVGTPAVGAFTDGRLVGPEHLAAVTAKYNAYYASTRAGMSRIPTEVAPLRDDMRRFKSFYPAVAFPNVYFVVGALNSGGTSSAGVGLIIGAEKVSRPPLPRGVEPAADAGQPVTAIPSIVSHELVHFNQDDAYPQNLLGLSLIEGSADFIGGARRRPRSRRPNVGVRVQERRRDLVALLTTTGQQRSRRYRRLALFVSGAAQSTRIHRLLGRIPDRSKLLLERSRQTRCDRGDLTYERFRRISGRQRISG